MRWLVFVIFGAVCATATAAPTAKADGFTLDDVLSGRFSPVGFNGTWISDNEFSYRSTAGGFDVYNVDTRVSTVVVAPEVLAPLRGSSYQLSADRNYLLYRTDVTQVWRYSSYARYSVIDVNTNQIIPLQPAPSDPQSLLRYATWNKVGNGLVYVFDNDIYYRPTPTAQNDIRLTSDGQTDTIFNGIPDWVYEEEVLGSNNAIWISPDGVRMVFATFNDTMVDNFDYPMYGAPSTVQDQYPRTIPLRYPKAGRTNPTVALKVANLVNGTVWPSAVIPPVEFFAVDHYFVAVDWPEVDVFHVAWLNRFQNLSLWSYCESYTVTCRTEQVVYDQEGWVDFDIAPRFSADGKEILAVLPVAQGAAGKYKHLVLKQRLSSEPYIELTQGLWEVVDILGWDQVNRVAYVLGTSEEDPSDRHVYRVSTTVPYTTTCMTCNSFSEEAVACRSNSARFSTGLTYWVHGCNGPDVPGVIIKETSTGRTEFVVTLNRELRAALASKALPTMQDLKVQVAGGYEARVRIILPPSMNPNDKYPLLVYVYGGPKSQQISNRFSVNWGTHLASSRGVIYGLIDGRGSGYKGDRMLHEIYRRMGTVEIEDQIQVTKYLINNYQFIDADRTAIWGWSYGGFATAATLAKDAENVFKCGMSVAPVTNWIYYDSVYTERYMGLPTAEDNQLGYNNSDVCRLVENMRNKKFYLIHGTADDNVHYQQSMMLSKSLESADILFRQQSYPDENHSIGRLSRHLYHSLTNFLMADCFQLENEVWG